MPEHQQWALARYRQPIGRPGTVIAFANPGIMDYDTAAILRGYVDAGWDYRLERPVACSTRSAGTMRPSITTDTPVIGAGLGVGWTGMGAILKALGVDVDRFELPSYPEALRPWLGRKVESLPMEEVAHRVMRGKGPVFIKSDMNKQWCSGVLREYDDLVGLLHVPEHIMVTTSEVVTFAAEWRVFVLRGEVIHVAPYKGDPLAPSPPREQVEEMASAVDRRAWSFDLGLADDGRYLLVEAHTALTLGQYGLGPHYGQKLHQEAWEEAVSMRTG